MLTRNGNTPNVQIVSLVRDGGDFIDEFMRMVTGLNYPADHLKFIILEGDSQDDTFHKLASWKVDDPRIDIIKYDTGRPHYPSLVMAERFAHLADIYNKVLDAADTGWSDYIMFTPSDIIFDRNILQSLLSNDLDYVAPMYWRQDHPNGGRFYDIWGYRRNGENLRPYAMPWYQANFPSEPVEMDTVGGMVLMKAEIIAGGARHTPEEADHGLCKAAQALGYKVWCDPNSHIWHR